MSEFEMRGEHGPELVDLGPGSTVTPRERYETVTPEDQARHERRQREDPDHDLSSCWCCCWTCEVLDADL